MHKSIQSTKIYVNSYLESIPIVPHLHAYKYHKAIRHFCVIFGYENRNDWSVMVSSRIKLNNNMENIYQCMWNF